MMGTKFDIPRLKLRERTGVYATGRARILQILETAFDIVMTKGYAALSLREIARACEIRVGAVSYYYRTKEDLIRDLLESAVAPYKDFAEDIERNDTIAPEQKFRIMVEMVLEDIRTEKTTKFYPELWALSNHDPFVSNLLDQTYSAQRAVFQRIIRSINPSLSEETARDLALYVSSSLEGMTLFVGYERSQADKFDRMNKLAVDNLLDVVRRATDTIFDEPGR
ncbi:TetR/AcrR family transcriptional regulator [Rhizorhabdus histidinilytica]|uniref:TetR/AcrR family transcriptional regulator n=1 Tax=Rhizorhabdus histidinilytica TaxID=439228 RepID=UPI00321F79BC